jgi:RNA polymerase sigma-70 factor (ECF subfamily)
MESFLKSIERPAYRMALLASRNREDALDLVQDAFCRFIDKYAHRPREEWKPLFYTILHNAIRDFGRRRTVRRCLLWFGVGTTKDGDDGREDLEDKHSPNPEHTAQVSHAFAALQDALARLPFRQRQAFLLRSWQELSVADTAGVMGCSEGSVKTHYSRATQTLREQLGDHWP